jgi:hypothetical protein
VELLLRRVSRQEAPIRHDRFAGALVIRNTTAAPTGRT